MPKIMTIIRFAAADQEGLHGRHPGDGGCGCTIRLSMIAMAAAVHHLRLHSGSAATLCGNTMRLPNQQRAAFAKPSRCEAAHEKRKPRPTA